MVEFLIALFTSFKQMADLVNALNIHSSCLVAVGVEAVNAFL